MEAEETVIVSKKIFLVVFWVVFQNGMNLLFMVFGAFVSSVTLIVMIIKDKKYNKNF